MATVSPIRSSEDSTAANPVDPPQAMTTSPTGSWPRTVAGRPGIRPSMILRSVAQIEASRIRTSASPDAISGTGSSRSSARPSPAKTYPFIVRTAVAPIASHSHAYVTLLDVTPLLALPRGSVEDHPPLGHHVHAVGDRERDRQLVDDEEDPA